MKREFDRYVVIKNTHAKEALTEDEYKELYRLGMKCAAWRKQNGKIPFKCVVVEHDWPEYEEVWKMIEDRCAEEHVNSVPSVEKDGYAEGYADASRHFAEKGFSLLRGIGSYCTGWNTYMWSTESES